MTKIFPHCTISVGLAPLADYIRYLRKMCIYGMTHVRLYIYIDSAGIEQTR